MSYIAFRALVRRDLRLFFLDKRAVIMSFVAPIVLAAFFGYIFGPVSSDSGAASKIGVAAVDQDGGDIAKKLLAAMAADASLQVQSRNLAEARESVRRGKTTVAIVVPPQFGERAGKAFFRGTDRPEIQLLYDPSHSAELQMVRGLLTQHVMEVVSRETMGGGTQSQRLLDESLQALNSAGSGMSVADSAALRHMLEGIGAWERVQRSSPPSQSPAGGGFNMPYSVSQEAVTAHKGAPYNSMAHAFAGMCVQFILFMGIDAGMVVLAQRRTGLWKRLEAAPLSRYVLIGSRSASSAIIAMIIMLTVFGFARVVFGVHIDGSFLGFLGVCAAFAIMTATFGLLIAVLGRTPEATRGIAILVTLVLVMLGGSWVPAFLFPAWLQKASFAVPTRWAVDGLDGTVWRGIGLDAARWPIGALLGFAVVFGAIAVWRFRWEVA
jgi:ABC-2 type transport system permease protein